jgi:DNA-binding NarL/FixJ family response regulator
VVVIDDHEMIVQSLVRLLTVDPKIEVVGTAMNAAEGIDVVVRVRPSVVVIDYYLPDMEAPQAIKMLLEAVPDVKVVILSGSESPASNDAVEASGSAAWVRKTEAIQDLRTAILKVASGEQHVSDELELRPPVDSARSGLPPSSVTVAPSTARDPSIETN